MRNVLIKKSKNYKDRILKKVLQLSGFNLEYMGESEKIELFDLSQKSRRLAFFTDV